MSLIERAAARSRALRGKSELQREYEPTKIDLSASERESGKRGFAEIDETHPLVVAPHSIPQIGLNSDVLADNRVLAHDPSAPLANLFAVLGTQVVTTMDAHGFTSLAIISATSGAGKSTLSTNLAISIAKRANESVLLVDLDLRKPTLSSLLGLDPAVGIEDYLEGKTELQDVMTSFTQFERLTVVPGIRACSNIEEVLHSRKMKSLIRGFQSNAPARRVIYDLPPLIGLSDALALLPQFDCVLFVAEEGVTTREEIKECRRLIGNTPLLGSIINKGKESRSFKYGYYYGSR